MSDTAPDCFDEDRSHGDDLPSWLDDLQPPFDHEGHLPPVTDDQPGGDPPRRGRPADPDPELGAGFTAAVVGLPIAFSALSLIAATAPASWGPLGGLLLGGAISALYLGVCWGGALWIRSHRFG